MPHRPRPGRITPTTPLFMTLVEEPVRPRVLVIDDEEAVRNAIASLLGRRGCDAVTAESGPAALDRLRAEYFDVLLVDVKMPGMSGLQLLSEAMLLDRDLPVLMLTGMNDMATARDALARGAMDFLTKPIELDELDKAVKSATRYRRHELEKHRAQKNDSPTAAHPMEELELVGGPLGGRHVRLEDRSFRLWVVIKPDGQHVWAALTLPRELPADTRLLGSYTLSSTNQEMTWEPKPGA